MRFLAVALFLAVSPWAIAQSDPAGLSPHFEYKKRIEAAENISPLDNGLFGEQVGLYNGSTTFSVVDIDLPGNSALPLRFARRHAVELQPQNSLFPYDSLLKGVGNWDVDVPFMTATYAQSTGWNYQRCSVGSVPSGTSLFPVGDIWQGISVHIPGRGDASALGIRPEVPMPTSGAQYKLTTSERDAFDCIPMQSGLSGEGFRMTTTSGVRYYFDVGTLRTAATLERFLLRDEMTFPEPWYMPRNRYYLLASKMEDKFGNTVQIQYNTQGHPTRIWASDGREILLAYANGRLLTATAHGRTWSYQYHASGDLAAVLLPDGAQWSYSYVGNLKPSPDPASWGPLPWCKGFPSMLDDTYVLNAQHPSGALGTFTFNNRRHYRSGVHATECTFSGGSISGGEVNYKLVTPHYFDVMSLDSKSIGGPGVAPMTWIYDYGISPQMLWGIHTQPAAYPCATCATEKTVTTINPDGSKLLQRFGILYRSNEGRVLGGSTLNPDGTVLRSESSEYLPESVISQQAFHGEYGVVLGNVSDPSSARVRPIVKRTIVQQGTQFIWEVDAACGANSSTYCFDGLGRPVRVTKSSAPSP